MPNEQCSTSSYSWKLLFHFFRKEDVLWSDFLMNTVNSDVTQMRVAINEKGLLSKVILGWEHKWDIQSWVGQFWGFLLFPDVAMVSPLLLGSWELTWAHTQAGLHPMELHLV